MKLWQLINNDQNASFNLQIYLENFKWLRDLVVDEQLPYVEQSHINHLGIRAVILSQFSSN